MSRRYASIDTCVERQTQVCLNSFTAPQNSNSDARLSACAASYPASALVHRDLLANVTASACLSNAGPRNDGDPCAFAGQCQSTFCSIPTGSACGTCAAVPAVGDDCTMHRLRPSRPRVRRLRQHLRAAGAASGATATTPTRSARRVSRA